MKLEHTGIDSADRNFQAIEQFLNTLGIFWGTGSPEGVVTAPVSSLFKRFDGGAGTSIYVKESSPTPSTGWIGK